MFFSHNYGRTTTDSYDSLPLEKTLTLHNAMILIKSLFNKNQNHYYLQYIFRKMFFSITKK